VLEAVSNKAQRMLNGVTGDNNGLGIHGTP
jgi:hypothetical protein